jgi:hypothetical protein
VSPYGDLAQRKVDYWRTNEVKNLKKMLIHKHSQKNILYFLDFLLKFSSYIVLEAKCVGNWKSETH